MADENRFKFELKTDLPRTTTKQEYKSIARWLRICRREVAKRLNPKIPEIRQALFDTVIYGTGRVIL